MSIEQEFADKLVQYKHIIYKVCFMYADNKDKNIRVEFIGDRRYTTTMSPTDRQAVAGVYELSKILSAMQQIKKEQEDANLKIGFINKKKERKAMEEAAEE